MTHWPIIFIILIFVAIPFVLKSEKYIERENLKWKIWLISLPVFAALFFIEFFCLDGFSNFDSSNILGWLGLSLGVWLTLISVVFLGRSFRSKWEVSPSEADDNADDIFDMAMKIGKEKREGKDTSELQVEYEQKVKNFEETGDPNKTNW